MKVALLFSSKAGMEATLSHRPDERRDEEDEPPSPVDLFAECDSDETIAAVGRVLQERHQVVFIESDEKAYARLKRQRPHLVFNIAERVVGPNRESHIPTICEMLDIPYTGSDPLTLGLCLDKSRAKDPESGILDRRIRGRHPGRRPAPGHRQAPLRRFEQGHQEQLPCSYAGRPLRARG